MNTPDTSAPENFPALDAGGALGGAQLKFSVSLDRDGRHREVGRLIDRRAQSYEECSRILSWAIPFMEGKVAEEKYQRMGCTDLLAKLNANLRDDFEVPPELRPWILSKVAEHFGWCPPST